MRIRRYLGNLEKSWIDKGVRAGRSVEDRLLRKQEVRGSNPRQSI